MIVPQARITLDTRRSANELSVLEKGSPMRRSHFLCIAAAAAALSLSSSALAQEIPTKPLEPKLRRNVGLGTAFGGGVVAAGAFSPTGSLGTGVLPAVMLPTFELQFFIDHKYSIDLTIPVTNIVIASAVLESFAFSTDAFFNFNIGTGNARMILGPGLGFSFIAGSQNAIGSIRVPAEIGLELITNNEAFGFKIMARPWVEFVPTSNTSIVGGGAIGLLGLSGYITE